MEKKNWKKKIDSLNGGKKTEKAAENDQKTGATCRPGTDRHLR